MLWIAAHANWIKLGPGWIGLGFGFLIGFMITLSLFRFSYHVLREVALGRKYITPPDLESTNPVGELSLALHASLYTLLP